jgi:hypothetical protein
VTLLPTTTILACESNWVEDGWLSFATILLIGVAQITDIVALNTLAQRC